MTAGGTGRSTRVRRLLLGAVLGLVLVGCKVDATVSITVRDDGSGVVRVDVAADDEAVKAVESRGGTLEQAVRLTDLAAAGWKVGAWEKQPEGGASIVLSHRFSSVDQVASIVQQISGDNGPLQGIAVTRDRGTFQVDYASEGTADLENVKSGVTADPELVAQLSGQQVDPNVVDAQLLAQVKAAFALHVRVKLPGAAAKTFTPPAGESTSLATSTSVLDTERVILVAAAAGFLVLALVVALGGGRRRRRGRGRPSSPPRRPAPAGRRPTGPARPPSTPAPPPRRR